MNSFAFWVENLDNKTTAIYECHLNIWYDKENKSKNYIEFGFMYDNSIMTQLKLYLPFKVEKSMIEDVVAKRIFNNGKLLGALFNTTIESLENGSVKMKHNIHNEFKLLKIKFLIDDIKDGGSLINIVPKLEGKNSMDIRQKCYIRFRIYKIDKIIKLVDENLSFIEGIFRKSGIFELNINNIRKMPEQIALQMNKSSYSFYRIHVFLMFDNSVDIYFENFNLADARILENHIWDDYIKISNLNIHNDEHKITELEKVIAYHWFKDSTNKKHNHVNNFNLFIKMKYVKFNLKTLTKACIFIIILGTIGSMLSNGLNIESAIIISILSFLLIEIVYC